MKITLISHASLLVETNGVQILTDPWYEGTIYNKAWAVCPPPLRVPDYTKLDALFISHAHPDHFEMRTLEKIRDQRGKDLPIFVAMFFFNNMKRALRDAGFRIVTEMVPGREFSPFRDVHFYSQQFRLDDSLIVIRGDETLVNINDTPLRGRVLADLAERYPRVDYVTAQFAIAQGYPYCYDGIEADFTRDDLIKRFDSFSQVLKPRHMIPFASFVHFCNADNVHMNQHKTTLDQLQERSSVPLTVLYPGDAIERGTVQHDPSNRTYFELSDAKASASVVTDREDISANDMDAAMRQFTQSLAKRSPTILRKKLPPFALIITDGGYGYRVIDGRATRADLAELETLPIKYRMVAEVLYDCIRFDWGWADLSIGARFRASVAPGWQGRELWFWIVPMLAGEGYLKFWNFWFLRPRSIRVAWGRRLEIWDYARSVISGKFMTQVIRKKTSAVATEIG